MLRNYISQFIGYCQTVGFLPKSLETLSLRLSEFNKFVNQKQIDTIQQISYSHLLQFIADYNKPSVHVKKARVWSLRQFFHFLKANKIIDINIALDIPYPKVTKTIPHFLTIDEFNKILAYFAQKADCLTGLRNLIIIMLLGLLGLRLSSILRLNIKDVNLNLKAKEITVTGKGKRQRILPLNNEMVQVLSEWIAVRHNFLNSRDNKALFISKKGNRLAIRTMEDNFIKVLKNSKLSLHFKVTCHTLRHSFASHLNDNGTEVLVIQSLLGHSSPKSSQVYIHPSEQRVRQALERLPGVVFMNKLIESGTLQLKFQSTYRPKRE